MNKVSDWQVAKNPVSGYVNINLTPREAKIASMVLADTLTSEIADYFQIETERVDQIINKVRRKIDFARAKMAKAAQEAQESQEGNDEE